MPEAEQCLFNSLPLNCVVVLRDINILHILTQSKSYSYLGKDHLRLLADVYMIKSSWTSAFDLSLFCFDYNTNNGI